MTGIILKYGRVYMGSTVQTVGQQGLPKQTFGSVLFLMGTNNWCMGLEVEEIIVILFELCMVYLHGSMTIGTLDTLWFLFKIFMKG